MSSQISFNGPNMGYILELYEQYLHAPDTLDDTTRRFFQHWSPSTNGVFVPAMPTADAVDMQKIVGAANYAQSIRQFGHLEANIDPLGIERQEDPDLHPEAHGITDADLQQLPASFVGEHFAHYDNALDAIDALKQIYTSTSGFDNGHIHDADERQWLREAIESRHFQFEGDTETSIALLERLSQIETFEHFLQRSFPTKYRFSIEGLDMMVPMLDEVVRLASGTELETIAIAMAHRGRLNVLAHIMDKPYQQILADFKDPLMLQEASHAIGWTIGDVKYHKGVQREIDTDATHHLLITMPPNPSHLELVNPVAVGMARATITDAEKAGNPKYHVERALQILIHGDASFSGQGIVAETFNMSSLPGYTVGGTIHIIANNQVGFTTLPVDGRSTTYASDLAKGFGVPIIHVNADDPAACIEVMRIAYAYQDRFEKDFLIDLTGYRRYGHNELDEPRFTQPLMYQRVNNHPTVRELWSQKLIDQQMIDSSRPDEIKREFADSLQKEYDATPDIEDLMKPEEPEPPVGAAKQVITAVSEKRLREINDSLAKTIEDFNFLSKRFQKTIEAKRTVFEEEEVNLDWATAEELAFATILAAGTPIRVTGQDSERGTFSHRHAVLHDADTGEKLTPLQIFSEAKASFEIHNSPLSEASVLAFEYGYNVQSGNRLVIWEAQYGDFANGAQNVIDEFIVSAREKWGLHPSLVLLLPHGHEGAGPDHSSGRPERFLQSAAKTNLRLVNCTTSAQYFHVLRRQAALLETDPLPLIVMTPKSLLRNPMVASSLDDFTKGKWQAVIDDNEVDKKKATRLVFCTGKFYYDLLTSEHREQYPHVALVRVEQLYPFPVDDLQAVVNNYPKLKQIVWAQEEPKNMGGWDFMNYRLKKLVGRVLPVNYVGRRRSSSPAEGSKTAHNVNQDLITNYAFSWEFTQNKSGEDE